MSANLADQTLGEVADRQAITDLIYRYCRSMDRADAELGYSVWHPDGTADYSAQFFQGTGYDYIDWVCAHHLQVLHHPLAPGEQHHHRAGWG